MHQVFLFTENSHCEANRKIFRRKIVLITIPLDKKDLYTGVRWFPSIHYKRKTIAC